MQGKTLILERLKALAAGPWAGGLIWRNVVVYNVGLRSDFLAPRRRCCRWMRAVQTPP